VDDRDRVGLDPAGFHVLEEVEIDLGKVGRDGRDTEEPLEAAFGQIGRDRFTIDEGNAVLLGDGAGGQRDARLIGAAERDHLLFGDQAQRLVLPDRGTALVVGEYDLDLGAAEPLEAGIVGEHQIAETALAAVDDLDGGFDRGLAMRAGARGVAAERQDHADLDGLVLGLRHACQRNRHGGSRNQPSDVFECHFKNLRKIPPGVWLLRALDKPGLKARCFPCF